MTGGLLDQSIEGNPSQADDKSFHVLKTASATPSSSLLNPPSANPPQDHAFETTSCEAGTKLDVSFRKKISKLLQGKEAEWTAVVQKDGPLQLLDLPMDILKEIVKEVTHTNDLTALALTHSALHALAIPHIYSRFDIVWPDATSSNDSRTGVDALTYGLATLVSGQDIMGYGGPERRRLGNHYAQFTRKFSLGNGPADWIQDYMITKESGKMLGTLVALAVARMTNLESFIWDMPTGVLRDVWAALSSLPNKSPSGECRLEKVLVRWHDNSLDRTPSPINSNLQSVAPFIPPGSIVTPIGISVTPPVPLSPAGQGVQDSFHPQVDHQSTSQLDVGIRNRVEFPTLSVLPSLKSLSVLDVDELLYLDEMSVLIERSKDRLIELRVGISKKAQFRDFVLTWDGPHLHQVDHEAMMGSQTVDDRRLGGVLGILLGRVCDIRKKKVPNGEFSASSTLSKGSMFSEPPQEAAEFTDVVHDSPQGLNVEDPTIEEVDAAFFTTQSTADSHIASLTQSSENLLEEAREISITTSSTFKPPATTATLQDPSKVESYDIPFRSKEMETQRPHLHGKLKLQNLELERVPLSVAVLQRGFDWSVLTSLTILDCAYHEGLWRMLRRQFQPRPQHSSSGLGYERSGAASRTISLEYQLSLKKIHTDIATPALISFLKETLAPNTLEVLFLQDRRKTTSSSVTIEAIYRGPLRRHRRSLRKLLLDSSDKIPKAPNDPSDSSRWRTWMLTHDVLTFLTGGNMTSLRELSVSIDYKDWHFLLRRLPQIPHLRSLNVPFIADHVTPTYDPRELAMQIVNMIFLRPEIELCYVGISNKCFEILENRSNDDGTSSSGVHGLSDGEDGESGDHLSDTHDDDDDDDGDDGSETDGDEEGGDEVVENDDDGTATEAVEAEGNEYAISDHDDFDVDSSDGSVDDRPSVPLRLREILFYDDRIDLFRARHMKL
ncbi:MAG: hypothetical protein M1818_001476 [Claussenomyces sp. TS43310]|nr:MAG: hypothetical protein M1818_001476 [Claussenomyces sp. TS43310]